MNMRQLKRMHDARHNIAMLRLIRTRFTHYALPDWVGHGDTMIMGLADSAGRLLPEGHQFHEPLVNTILHEALHIKTLMEQVEQAKIEFVCQKVKDGSVVDTFDTREAALELVLKHARQKKAKLQVMNSLTGELVLFTEEEMAA